MTILLRHIAISLAIILNMISVSAYAQTIRDDGKKAADSYTDSVALWFRTSKIDVDPNFRDNSQNLERVQEWIKTHLTPDSPLRLTRVTVTGGASPEGDVSFNEMLSHRRAERIFEYLSRSVEINDSITSFRLKGRDWPGLLRLVRADKQVPYRNEVLKLLSKVDANKSLTEAESDDLLLRLKRIGYGIAYKYLHDELFKHLRTSTLTLCFSIPEAPQKMRVLTLLMPEMPADIAEPPSRSTALSEIDWHTPRKRPFSMNLHTNLLYDLAAMPNIGMEFYLGNNVSIAADWTYAWWSSNPRHRYWRSYGGEATIRWWWGNAARQRRFTGHHIGIYGGVSTYDFEFGDKGYLGGKPGGTLWDQPNINLGIEYGYSIPIASRLNLDFSAGLGYYGGKCYVYRPMGNLYLWEKTMIRRWYGPTRAAISLVWLIGKK